MNFDVPITTFVISVLCLGPSEMTEMIQTQKLKNKEKKTQFSLCGLYSHNSGATFL